MKKNVGKTDAYIRYALALVLVVLAYYFSWWILIPAVIMVVTGYRRECHVYKLCGKDTCGTNQ